MSKTANCPLGKQMTTAGTSFEDKTVQCAIWIMYCETEWQKQKEKKNGRSWWAWISWIYAATTKMRIFLVTEENPSSVNIHKRVICLFYLHRVKLKEGLTFLGARPSNPTQWIVSQDVRSEGHRVVTLHCRRKESGYDQQRSEYSSLHFEINQDFRRMTFWLPSYDF